MDISQYIYDTFYIDPAIAGFVNSCEQNVSPQFARLEEIAQFNQFKVISAFQKNQISTRHFNPSTGYGYGDEGREKLSAVFADALGAECAIVSPLIMSGTHAISMALFGVLRPGDVVLSITGSPYDTLQPSLKGVSGSLAEYGVAFESISLRGDAIDIERARIALRDNAKIKMVYIQRSTGYSVRCALTTERIGAAISELKAEFPDKIYFVDNCYGEFVCLDEPTQCGADLMAGSLIKNPGGGLAPTGGYIAGNQNLIERIGARYSAPGVGTEIGSYAYGYQLFFQGLFMAPHTVLQALKCVVLAAEVFEKLGYQTTPGASQERGDITQTITFGSEEPLTSFVRGIQRASAVDGHVVPYAWDMPGYQDKVIMAAGTFVQGASVELTADAPIRPPYCAYLQGALTYEHAKLGILYALDELNIHIK